MIIENLKLKRFGGHELIDFNSTSSVVGVFGANGSGKSTLLEALKFAITGETQNNQNTYVKDLDGSGSVIVRFRKNGKVGTIERNIGTKTTRSLDWDGRHIKAAKEVNAAMADIFGADKKAVANAVFVSQGQMQNMLFCGSAERRDAFVELLNLSFCAVRADTLWRKIQKLQATIVDLTPAMDAAVVQRDAAAQAYLDKKTIWEASYSWETEWQYLVDTQKAANELQIFQTQSAQAITDHDIKTSELNGLLTKFNWVSVESCADILSQSRVQLSDMEKQLAMKQSINAQLAHYDRVNKDITGIYKEISGVQTKMFTADPANSGLLEWMKRKGTLDEDERIAARRQQLTIELASERNTLAQLNTPIPQPVGVDAEYLADLQTRVNTASWDANTHAKNLQMQKDIMGCFGSVDTIVDKIKCPKCDLTITDANRLSAEEIARMEEIGKNLSVTHMALVTEWRTKNASWAKYNRDVEVRENIKFQTEARIAKADAELQTLPVIDADLVVFEREKIDGIIAVLRSAEDELQSARKRLSAKLTERNGYKLAEKYMPSRGEYADEIIGELLVRKQADKDRIDLAARQLQFLMQVQQEVVRLSKLQDTLKVEIDMRSALLKQEETAELTNLRQTISDPGLLQQEVDAQRTKYAEMRAQVSQLEISYAESNKAFYELEDRMKKDEQKLLLIKDLLKVKDLLSNDGLPLSYSRLQFEKLANLTQINLAKLNATFAIEIDRSKDLSFSFKRLDRDGGVLLPMASLSGGQRVRLCVAFLIAVQKHLVPEVGLLVLDEPTTSVDPEGRVEIATFLADMGRELQNTEMQVWVCDHSAEVRDRIECKIEL